MKCDKAATQKFPQTNIYLMQMPKYLSALGCTYAMIQISLNSKSLCHYTTTVAIKICFYSGRVLFSNA